MFITLQELIPQAKDHICITKLVLNSLDIILDKEERYLFFAVPGSSSDGRLYINDALNRGAVSVIYELNGKEKFVIPNNEKCIPINNLKKKISYIAGKFYGHPSKKLKIIGITGTNGKTSISYLLAQSLSFLGSNKCGIIGSLGSGFINDYLKDIFNKTTTPDPIILQYILFKLKQSFASVVAIEVSSHALHQHRVEAIDFDIVVFTNLSRDHLDYHSSIKSYALAKSRLFCFKGIKCKIINLDDKFGEKLYHIHSKTESVKLITYSVTNKKAFIYCYNYKVSNVGIEARLITPYGDGVIRSCLLGMFNLSNLIAVIVILLELGYELHKIINIIPKLNPPSGRMQMIGGNGVPLIVIDYAHTPDALYKVLSTLRPFVKGKGKLSCLFGCGGNRDFGKRKLIAKIVEQLADTILVTNDNPRSESSYKIISDIYSGFSIVDNVKCIPSRKSAINNMIMSATAEDVLLIAGKGHETYQEMNGVFFHFSDYTHSTKALIKWKKRHDKKNYIS